MPHLVFAVLALGLVVSTESRGDPTPSSFVIQFEGTDIPGRPPVEIGGCATCPVRKPTPPPPPPAGNGGGGPGHKVPH
jgi:hypothetical protein